MLDFSLGELTLIGVVALVVLGPERLPRVARTMGEWLGKAQRYVGQVRTDIQREIELSDLKRLQDEARKAAQSIDSTLRDAASSLSSPALPSEESSQADPVAVAQAAAWGSHRFRTRRRPGATFTQLEEAVERLQGRIDGPGGARVARNRYAPRSRVSRPRIHR
jgi:Tat protein translocase TatB subunit